MLSIKPMATILKEKIFENARFYNGKPSVTTVLKIINDPGMEKIKLMKGEEARDKLMEYKAWLWTILHKAIEKTYQTKKFVSTSTPHWKAWLTFYTREWYKWEPIAIETILEDELVWGTADAVMTFNNELFLVDWKSCWKELYPSLVDKYKLQLSKYVRMYNQINWTNIEHAKIVAFSDAWWYRPLLINKIDYNADIFDELTQEFYSLYKIRNEIQSWTGWISKGSISGQGSLSDSDGEVSIPWHLSMRWWDF